MSGTDPRATLLGAGLAAAARGWRVFPISPGRKRPPAVRDWEHRATTDPARIERAWQAGAYNVGIACGPSSLVVIDVDRPKPGEVAPPAYRQPGIRDGGDVLAVLCEANDQPLPVDTYAVRTASGGTHLYFTAPPGITLRNTAKRLGWLIDTRAHGGYVVAAGSTVDRHPYTVLVDENPAPLPGWLTDRLADPQPAPVTDRTTTPVTGSPSAYAAAALRGELDRVLAAADGTRNHTLNTAAFALGQLVAAGLLPRRLVDDALTLAGQAIGLPARECAKTIRSGLDSGGRTPRQPASRDPRLDTTPDHRPAA
jgi:hypothetical protein